MADESALRDPFEDAGISPDVPKRGSGSFARARRAETDPAVAFITPYVQKFEGLNLKPFDDIGGRNIGYGTPAQPGETEITRDEADRRLNDSLSRISADLDKRITKPLSPEQKGAVISLVYNLAGNADKASGLISRINNDDMKGAQESFRAYSHAGGKYMQGLDTRRIREAGIFANGDDPGKAYAETVLKSGPTPPLGDSAQGAPPRQRSAEQPGLLARIGNAIIPSAEAAELSPRDPFADAGIDPAKLRDPFADAPSNTAKLPAPARNGSDVYQRIGETPKPSAPTSNTTLQGIIGALTRGLAPYAGAAAAGGLAGSTVLPVIGTVAGAGAGAGALALTDLATGLYRQVAPHFGLSGDVQTPTEMTQNALTAVGVPQARTGIERMVQSGASGLSGGAGVAASMEAAAANAAPGIVRNVLLAGGEDVSGQAASGLAGGIAGQAAAEVGGGPVEQLFASLVGGLAGGGARPAVDAPGRAWDAATAGLREPPRPPPPPPRPETWREEVDRIKQARLSPENRDLEFYPEGRDRRLVQLEAESRSPWFSPDRPSPSAPPPEAPTGAAATALLTKLLSQDQKGTEGTTPYGYAKNMLARRNAAPDAPLALGDLAGKNVLGIQGTASRRQGPGMEMLNRAALDRLAGREGRTVEAIDRAFGSKDPYVEIKSIDKERRAATAPWYDQAYSHDPINPDLLTKSAPGTANEPLMARPSMKRAVSRAMTIAAEEGRDPKSLGITFDEAGDIKFVKVPSWQTLDYIKRGLDDVIESHRNPITRRLELDEKGRAEQETRTLYRKMLVQENPKYAEALKEWAGPSQIIDAANFGKDIFAKKIATGAIRDRVAGMTDSELDATRMGLAGMLREHGVPWTPKGRSFIENRIRLLFRDTPEDKAKADRFVNDLDAEATMSATDYKTHGGSPTALRMSEDAQTEQLQRLIQDVQSGARGDVASIAFRHGLQYLTDRNARISQDVMTEIAKVLSRPLDYGTSGMRLLEDFATKSPQARKTRNYLDYLAAPRGFSPYPTVQNALAPHQTQKPGQ